MASMYPPKRGTAFDLYFSLYKSDGSVIANPGTYTKRVGKDGGALADTTNAVSEVDTTYGFLKLTLTADEMTADSVYVQVKDDTTGCVPFTATLYTAAETQDEVNDNVDLRLLTSGYTAPPSASTNASAVRTELTTELGRIDVATSTRLASASYTTPPTAADNADAVWDEVLTGATHNVPSSAGRRLRQVAGNVIYTGTVVSAGINGNQVVLDSGASSVDGAYDPAIIVVAGQSRRVLDYVGSTRTATVNRNWRVNPANGDDFTVYADAGSGSTNEGLVRAATTTTVRLNASARPEDGVYVGQVVSLISGTGDDQARLVTAYDGTTQTATIERAWDVLPDTTTGYEMLPLLSPTDYATADDLAADTEDVLLAIGALPTPLDSAQTTAAVEAASITVDQTAVLAAIDAVPAEVDATLTASKGVGPWGPRLEGWVEVTGATLDTEGDSLMLDRPDVLVAAYLGGVLTGATRSDASGDFSLYLPPDGTYTLAATAVGFTYAERTVTL